MKWFEGAIPDAIQSAKNKHTILVVYIEGQDEMSTKMEGTWSDDSVVAKCEISGFIALKLKANSETAAQFCQIYPVVCVPCTFFIGENGVPLEVMGGHVEPQQFVDKINTVITMHEEQFSSQSPLASSSNPTPALVTGSERGSAGSSGTAKPDVPLEDRVNKVQDLINQKREERLLAEQEKNKAKEKERIQMGRDLAKLKAWKAEQEARELREQMNKDRKEEKEARQRIRDQIAKDREERAVKFQKDKEERELARLVKQEAKQAAQQISEEKMVEERRLTASIQFRLPDGSRITHSFKSCETLGAARAYLLENVSMTSVHFYCNYPKKDFEESDMAKSLLDLGLSPSAALIVVPKGSRSLAPSGGTGGGFMWMLLSPFVGLWNFVYNFLFGGTPSQPPPSSQTPAPQTSQTIPPASGGARPKSSYGLRSRREGNMHRLTNKDDDDESATWNGNSTQQM